MNNTDEAIHGYYIGYKFQLAFNELSEEAQDAYKMFAIELLMLLYDNECEYTKEMYAELGLEQDVIRFLHYNANKAMMNLGFEPVFAEETTRANASVLAALGSLDNHDFFSEAGSKYKMIDVEQTQPSDYDGILEMFDLFQKT